MRLGVIACEVFMREVSAAIAISSSICTVRWLPQGLHDTPDRLRELLQQQIGALEEQAREDASRCGLDAIVLAYGLCGGATAGLCAGSLPLIIPCTEDCIGLLLGGAARYETIFRQYSGTYWLSCGWCERANLPGERYYTAKRQMYATQHGADNADWLMEQENAWIARYSTCIYICPPLGVAPDYTAQAQETADYCGWKLICEQGDNQLLEELLAGAWDDHIFQICLPGSVSRMPGLESAYL